MLVYTKVLLCAVVFHERTDWKLKYAGPPTPAGVVKTILHLLYNLTADLTYTVVGCKAARVLLMTSRKEGPAEPGAQRLSSDDHNAETKTQLARQERFKHLKRQLGKTA